MWHGCTHRSRGPLRRRPAPPVSRSVGRSTLRRRRPCTGTSRAPSAHRPTPSSNRRLERAARPPRPGPDRRALRATARRRRARPPPARTASCPDAPAESRTASRTSANGANSRPVDHRRIIRRTSSSAAVRGSRSRSTNPSRSSTAASSSSCAPACSAAWRMRCSRSRRDGSALGTSGHRSNARRSSRSISLAPPARPAASEPSNAHRYASSR